MKSKILVGTPIFELNKYCLEEYENSVKNLTYTNYDILLIDNSKKENFYKELLKRNLPALKIPYYEKARKRIAESHNLLRQKVLEENYDYLFLLDADVIPPKNVIERLLSHNKKIISGLYFNLQTVNDLKGYFPVIRVEIQGTKEKWRIPQLQEYEGRLIKIVSSGTGCLLIHKDILKNYDFWYKEKGKGADDIYFFKSLLDDNKECWCDCSILCKHLIKNKPYSYKKYFLENKY